MVKMHSHNFDFSSNNSQVITSNPWPSKFPVQHLPVQYLLLLLSTMSISFSVFHHMIRAFHFYYIGDITLIICCSPKVFHQSLHINLAISILYLPLFLTPFYLSSPFPTSLFLNDFQALLIHRFFGCSILVQNFLESAEELGVNLDVAGF